MVFSASGMPNRRSSTCTHSCRRLLEVENSTSIHTVVTQCTSVMTANVPSDPIMSRVRSYPADDLRVLQEESHTK